MIFVNLFYKVEGRKRRGGVRVDEMDEIENSSTKEGIQNVERILEQI